MEDHVYENLLQPLINHYGEMKVPKGSCIEEIKRTWADNFRGYKATALIGAAKKYISQDKFGRFPPLGALNDFLIKDDSIESEEESVSQSLLDAKDQFYNWYWEFKEMKRGETANIQNQKRFILYNAIKKFTENNREFCEKFHVGRSFVTWMELMCSVAWLHGYLPKAANEMYDKFKIKEQEKDVRG